VVSFFKRNPWMWLVLFLGVAMIVDIILVVFAIRTAPPAL
jgi:hypothetical protein